MWLHARDNPRHNTLRGCGASPTHTRGNAKDGVTPGFVAESPLGFPDPKWDTPLRSGRLVRRIPGVSLPLNPALIAAIPSGMKMRPLPEPGGFPDISRWLRSNATTPPVWIPNMPHPGGMPARPARMCRTSTHPSFHPPPPGPSANARPPEQTCIPLSLPTSASSPRLRAISRLFAPPAPASPQQKKSGISFRQSRSKSGAVPPVNPVPPPCL